MPGHSPLLGAIHPPATVKDTSPQPPGTHRDSGGKARCHMRFTYSRGSQDLPGSLRTRDCIPIVSGRKSAGPPVHSDSRPGRGEQGGPEQGGEGSAGASQPGEPRPPARARCPDQAGWALTSPRLYTSAPNPWVSRYFGLWKGMNKSNKEGKISQNVNSPRRWMVMVVKCGQAGCPDR